MADEKKPNALQKPLTPSPALAAVVDADRAAVATARFNLDNATIRAPIAGKTGSLLVRAGNLVRPGVVWFGESLPLAALTAAEDAVDGCEVLLVVGTSGAVWPAAGRPMRSRNSHSAQAATRALSRPNSRALLTSPRCGASSSGNSNDTASAPM